MESENLDSGEKKINIISDELDLYLEEVKNFDKKIRDIRLSLENFLGKKVMDDYFNDRTGGRLFQ